MQDYAWGGAKSNYANYNGFNWSGVLWQIEKYKFNTAPEKTQILAYNKTLAKLLLDKKNKIYLIDVSNLFNDLVNANYYKNTRDTWLSTYSYPTNNGYMWWDAWHPMTSVHKHIANHVEKEFRKMGIILLDTCN